MQGSPSLGHGLGGREGDTHTLWPHGPQAQGTASCPPPGQAYMGACISPLHQKPQGKAL